MRIRRTAIQCTALALLVASVATADTRTIPAEAIQIIDNGEGAQRVLLKMGEIEGVEDMAISRADLVLRTAGRMGETEPLELQVHPITEAWTPESVTWRTGWRRSGGDFADEMYARIEVDPSRLGQEIRINVESIVGAMRYGAPFHGFVVTALPYKGLGLRPVDVARLPNRSEARLIVEYEPMPRVRAPEGVR